MTAEVLSEEVRGAGFAGSSPPFLDRERAAVDVDVDPEHRLVQTVFFCPPTP